MQAVAEPPPAAQQPPAARVPAITPSERSTGSHASDHQQLSGSGSRMSSEPDSSPGSRERHVNGGAARTAGLLNLAAGG